MLPNGLSGELCLLIDCFGLRSKLSRILHGPTILACKVGFGPLVTIVSLQAHLDVALLGLNHPHCWLSWPAFVPTQRTNESRLLRENVESRLFLATTNHGHGPKKEKMYHCNRLGPKQLSRGTSVTFSYYPLGETNY